MNISDVEAFLAIVETRNLSQAAKSLYVTQSTISYRLDNLEKELNLRLVERNRGSRIVELTPKGKELISIAERWVSLWKETQLLQEQQVSEILTIAQVDWFSIYPFYRIFDGIVKQGNGSVKLDIKSGHSIPIVSMVNDMKADVGFVVRSIISKTIISTPIFRDPLVLVCSNKSQIKDRLISPRSLDSKNEVFWGYYGDYKFWHDQWWDSSVIPNLSVDMSSPMSFQLLEDEQRWLVSPRSVAEKTLRLYPELNLSIHYFSNPPPDLTVYMIQRAIPSSGSLSALSTFSDYVLNNINLITENRPYMDI